jgi:hypothetical protein
MTLQRGCHNPCIFFLCVCYLFSPKWCYALWTLLWCYAIHVILSVSPSTYTCFRWYKVFSCNLTSKNLYQQQGRFKLQLVMMEADLYNVISVCWFCGTLACSYTIGDLEPFTDAAKSLQEFQPLGWPGGCWRVEFPNMAKLRYPAPTQT